MAHLLQSSGNPAIDDYLEAIIAIYETAFPGRIRACYLVGSYADGTALPESDVDVEILFKGQMTAEERNRCDVLKTACRALCPIDLDFPVRAEKTLQTQNTIGLKLASKLLYGEDTRDSMPLPAMDDYLAWVSASVQHGLTARFRSEQVTLPLNYPIPDAEFYGYIPKNHKDGATPLKLWAVNIGRLASFLVVYHARVYVPSKRQVLPLYREHINDKWLKFITDVYEKGRNTWHYQIPQQDERTHLKALLQQTLDFETVVARIYLNYLREERQGTVATNYLKAFRHH